MRILALVTDAYGGRGGVAQFNRDMLGAVCEDAACEAVIALARVMPESPGPVPQRLHFEAYNGRGKMAYVRAVLRVLRTSGRLDLVMCGHLNLLPIACVAAAAKRAPLLLILHGVEAWERQDRYIIIRLLRFVHAFVAVSDFTKQRFLSWSGLSPQQAHVIPNCVDLSRFSPGPKPDHLLNRYGLANRVVLLSVGRLDSRERYKGHDEVIDVLPRIIRERPDVCYLVVGDGDDRRRLEAKAAQLGLGAHVVFAGYVSENEKPSHYRLADAFVMPGRGEGFGIVYLEALASGLPIVVSNKDASAEILREDIPGTVADPDDPDSVYQGIRCVLSLGRQNVPHGLGYYTVENFRRRWRSVIHRDSGSPELLTELSAVSHLT